MSPLALLLVVASATQGPRPLDSRPPAPGQPAAIVSGLAGGGGRVTVKGRERPLQLFAWLPAGARLRAAAGGNITLAYWNGRRYELGGEAEAAVEGTGLAVVRGPVRELSPVSPLPRIAAIQGRRMRSRGGATRIREGEVEGLYPSQGAVVLADATVLRFEGVSGASTYALEVQDDEGRAAFRASTSLTAVTVPPGVLVSGRRYVWTVRSTGVPPASGTAAFTTLPAREAEARAALQAASRTAGDTAALALMAGIDRDLGLWHEAREGLQAALAQAPADVELAQALRDLEGLLDLRSARP
jgi:hypothetical protein